MPGPAGTLAFALCHISNPFAIGIHWMVGCTKQPGTPEPACSLVFSLSFFWKSGSKVDQTAAKIGSLFSSQARSKCTLRPRKTQASVAVIIGLLNLIARNNS